MLKKKQKLELYSLPLTGVQNWHFEVISHSIFDNERLEEYYTLDHAKQSNANMEHVVYDEDKISDSTLLVHRYVMNEDDSINIYNAKRSHLGVLRIMQGKEEGKEYMFSLFDDSESIHIQLLVYGYLTYGLIDKKLLKGIKKNDDLDMLQIVAGKELFKEIMKNI